ncbi:protein of unknown function [Micromonospora phaseoli]|uniref:Uncharacterized protein n=1 Tax=Micromonospora phaseoli TaxID=1144548 RepID=A0A1H6ZKX7_9ACTN|nr:DUF4132 domain-containing protein [Micromonospora phaseoli]PZV97176.1 uncharacterized protein DUF4132 [Micromonospora phaseoli]GIJ77244.1 hypothetical protein Xph01_16760 [Micromonospora phaseoli]SEJ53346.1 protein of unknown function [Micromonospora phaseoli]
MTTITDPTWHVTRTRALVAENDLTALAGHLYTHARLCRDNPEVRAALRPLSRPDVARLVQAMVAVHRRDRSRKWATLELIGQLARRLPADLTPEQLQDLAAYAVEEPYSLSPTALETVARGMIAAGPLPAELVAVLVDRSDESQRLRQLMVELSGPQLDPADPWARQMLTELPTLDPAWQRLVGHASTAAMARPTVGWSTEASRLLTAIDPAETREVLGRWLAAATRTPHTPPTSANADLLRGLLWLVELTGPTPEQVRRIAGLVEAMLRRLPGIGPACPKVANAAVGVLGRIDGEAALAQLARLSARVTYKGTGNEIDKALDARAAALGIGRDEIEELAVPDYGLTGVGRHEVTLGGCRAELLIDSTSATLAWHNESGRQVKSPPAAVRRDHPAQLAELKGLAKEVTGMLAAQTARLDRLFLAQRHWTLTGWRQRYLDHPLVGALARRLIWLIGGVPCGWADGSLRTLDDTPVIARDDAEVRIWHPIGRPVPEVVGWREWLERHQIVQPFKQAHREVYLLTPAEETTGTYSNRFAGHILRQHQYHALAAIRGWTDRLRLMVDDSYPPTARELPRWGLRAEYWVEGIGDDWGADTTESGSYLRLVTDQVRFYPIAAAQNTSHASGGGYTSERWTGTVPADPLPLDQVPPLVLSEVMRDVDLFVGVSSVGNDPTWSDGGPQGRYRDYWASYSFGELSVTAETRRDLLTRLLPRLAVGRHARIDGRFLVVDGDLRTYRIHLGSGNILMSPNDEYLCIVPDRAAGRTGEQQFLPFEGDGMLAVILSKAMLLANDTKITDPSITQQIKPGG